MNKKTIIALIVAFLNVFILGMILLLVYQKSEKIEFYAVVEETNERNYLISPLVNEKIYKSYKIISVSIDDDLLVGDIIKIVAYNEVAEIYPPIMKIIAYEVIEKNSPTTKFKDEEITSQIKDSNVSSGNNSNLNQEIINKDTSNIDITTTTQKVKKTEGDVILEIESYVADTATNDKSNSFKDKMKNNFIKVIDFIFYDGDILGYKFKELNNSTKIKVVSLALNLDNKIEAKFPNYKNDLSQSYQKTKEKLVGFYLEMTTEFCNKNLSVCSEAKNNFAVLKSSLSLTWDFIAGLATTGISNLQEWYEIFSGK